jgi:hypothetical protein
MATFFNTTFAPSMVKDGNVNFRTMTVSEAAQLLSSEFENVANPMHSNTLQAVTQLLNADVTQAKGGRVLLAQGDQVLVAQVSNIPRETREFSDEEIAAAKFDFRLVTYLG